MCVCVRVCVCVFVWHKQREIYMQGHVCSQLCNYVSDRITLQTRHSITHTHSAEHPTPAYLGSRFTFTHLSMPHFITLLYFIWDSQRIFFYFSFPPNLDLLVFFSLSPAHISLTVSFTLISSLFPLPFFPFLVLLLL